MWTPLGALRGWVRRQALQELEKYVGDARTAAGKEVLRLTRLMAANITALAEGEAKPVIGKEAVLLDHFFKNPVVLGGYIDATGFEERDKCRVKVLVSVGGRDELTPLYNRDYAGVMEDTIALQEQPVRGRVQIVYVQELGIPAKVWYTFYGRK